MSMPGEPDYYQILGVSREAHPEEIKQAYHRQARRFHPDLHPNDAEAEACLRGLNQAYSILKDAEQRARYDRWGAWGPPVWHPQGKGPWHQWMAAVAQHLLTAQASLEAHKPQRGRDLRYILQLSPELCARGCEARLDIPQRRWCPECLGSRMLAGKSPTACPQCQGNGEIRRPGWALSTIRRCEVCQGEGRVITEPCQACGAEGSIPFRRILAIDVPAGVRYGSRLRIPREGESGRWGGPPGNLYVYIRPISSRSPLPQS